MTVEALVGRREAPGLGLVDSAEQVARACYDLAVRFHRGGTLIAFGTGEAAADAAHLAVEFVHPVIVGKRALPAVSLANDPVVLTGHDRGSPDGSFAAQLRQRGSHQDIAVAIAPGPPPPPVVAGLEAARKLGMLTIALTAAPVPAPAVAAAVPTAVPTAVPAAHRPAGDPLAQVDHVLTARTGDPLVAREVHVTAYHILWELVHVFLDRPALLAVPR